VKPKTKLAGKLKGGRPRRHQPSEEWLKNVRPWIPSALEGVTGGGTPSTPEKTKRLALSLLRGMSDDLTIAEEAFKYLVARDGRCMSREDRIASIADWLDMDVEKLTNWLNRAKRAR
jgi:hypothetical protein